MIPDNEAPGPDAPPPEMPIFSALLRPNRSLSGPGFLIIMALLSAFSFVAGIVFLLMGAWPVFGFFGLDVLLVYIAFRASYRASSAWEEVTVTPSELIVRRMSHHGRERRWVLNPLWARLDCDTHDEFGVEDVFLVSHGKRLALARCLGRREKGEFAAALRAALAEARRGPTRT